SSGKPITSGRSVTTSSMPTRERIATPFQRPSPRWTASYPRSARSVYGNCSSEILVSCRQSTSGFITCSHTLMRGIRLGREFTFQVTMRTPHCHKRLCRKRSVLADDPAVLRNQHPALDRLPLPGDHRPAHRHDGSPIPDVEADQQRAALAVAAVGDLVVGHVVHVGASTFEPWMAAAEADEFLMHPEPAFA